MRTTIYIVEQIFNETNEVLRAYRSLIEAQQFVQERAGVSHWETHNAHGNSWTSKDGDGNYAIVEIGLY